MNPIQKILLITSLAASLITLIAQSAGGDLAALLTALAVSAVAPILLPRLFGMQVIMVKPDEVPAVPALRAYTAELQAKCNQEGRVASDDEILEAMDQDVKQMQEVVADARKNPQLDRRVVMELDAKLAMLIRAREKYKELVNSQ